MQNTPYFQHKGFTTFELMLSLTIMSILLLIVGSTFSNILFTRNRISSDTAAHNFADQTLLILTQEARWANEIIFDPDTEELTIQTIDSETHVYRQQDQNLQKTTTTSSGSIINQVINPPNVRIVSFEIINRSPDSAYRPSFQITLTVENTYNQPNQPPSAYTNQTAITLRNRFPGSV